MSNSSVASHLDPRIYDAERAMPHYRFTDQQVSLLTAFLGSKTDSDLLIGSKPITQISFLPGMPHTVLEYISAKIRQPRAFGSALKMPPLEALHPSADGKTQLWL